MFNTDFIFVLQGSQIRRVFKKKKKKKKIQKELCIHKDLIMATFPCKSNTRKKNKKKKKKKKKKKSISSPYDQNFSYLQKIYPL